MPNSDVNGQVRGVIPAARDLAGDRHEPIAVVGIGCRFPGGANDPDAFWNLLANGVDAITEVPPDRWNVRTFYDPDRSKPGKSYTRWGGFVQAIDCFDPHCFGISPREAARMDPQQRLLMEVAWEALEDAGLARAQLAGTKTAVFAGISTFDYSVLTTEFSDRGKIDVHTNTGGSLSIAANRISYCFDLRGPSAAVDTACSSALVAVHLACQSIWRDGCPLALAGGVNALLLPDWFVGFCRMGMLAPDGRCRAFDARASGFVRSEGAGMVVLAPLTQARARGDRIYATILGTAVNQDGRTPGMTVPRQEAQEDLLRQACRSAGVAPARIHYVEAHGTGTPVGDPIEARALGRVLSAERPDGEPCLIGSVKTNIGHLEAGAGISGLIKVALALHHQRIPGNLHFERPNPEIDFMALGLRVPTRCEPWPASDGLPLAGVNAFGFGGTNAHVVLQGAAALSAAEVRSAGTRDSGARAHGAYLVCLSARTPEALRAAARSWKGFLAGCPDGISLGDIAWSAALRRSHHEDRLAVVAHTRGELAEALSEFAAGKPVANAALGRAADGKRPRLAFVCSGQGPQWWAMGRQLLREEPVFRSVIARCDAILRRLGGFSLLEELTRDEAASHMAVTAIAQPCLFALQVGLAALWASWGIRPDAVVGHSVGEVAAAYLAGVFSLDDALCVIYHRGRCMERAQPRGRMLAVGLPPEEARSWIRSHGGRVSLAAVNGPSSITLSGDGVPLEEIAALLAQRNVFCRFLAVEYAFHSAQMDPIRDELIAALGGIQPRRATLPFVSTVTARAVDGPELGPEYWWSNVRRTVRFADAVERLIERECDVFVELGPHPVLASALAQCLEHGGKRATALPTLRRGAEERALMLLSLGVLHTLGHPIDWTGVLGSPGRFVRLPLYPWQRERCWHEAEESRLSRLTPPAHPLLGVPQNGPRPVWQTRLDLRLTPYLADHRVQGAAVLPAAAYLEMSFVAAREVFGPGGCELDGIKLTKACFLAPDEPLWAQTSFDPDTATVSVHTRPVHGGADWTRHLTAFVRRSPANLPTSRDSAPARDNPDAIQMRCPSQITREACYEHLRQRGLDYGALFQGIERAWQGVGEALALARLPEALSQEAGEYIFHPALLDTCLQVVVAADARFRHRDRGLYLPTEVDRVHLFRQPGPCVWAHARLLEKTPSLYVADVDVYTEDGELAARLRRLRCQRVAGGYDESLDELLYAHRWELQPRAQGVCARGPGCWLVFADRGGAGARLARKLRARGDLCMLAYAGTDFEDKGGAHLQLSPARSEDTLRLIEAFARHRQLPCHGVVHLWNLDSPRAEAMRSERTAGEIHQSEALRADATGALDLHSAIDVGVQSLVHLVQGWDQAAGDQSAPLFVVTCGAQSVGRQPEPTVLLQAPALGLARVIASEYAPLRCKLIDLDPYAEDPVEPLFEEIQTEDEEDEVALRGPDRYVIRWLYAAGLPACDPPCPDRSDVPYGLAMERAGTIDGLALRRRRRRSPGPGEVEIGVAAAGLNFSDVMKALGIYPGLAEGPARLGIECSGRVTAVGTGVRWLDIGDEVLAVATCSFGSHVVARSELVARKPHCISFEEAAALPIAYLTASYALEHLGRVSSGESVLIHSASGGVGLAALQLARRAGAVVFATAGSREKREYLRALGVDLVMDSRTLDFAEQVLERTAGRGVDLILNSLPGAAITRGLSALAEYGRFLEIGKRDIYGDARLGLYHFHKNLSFCAIDLERVIRDRPGFLGSLLQGIARRVSAGELTPLPHRVWAIDDAPDAFRHMQHAQHVGKIVLSMHREPLAVLPAADEPVAFRADATYLITGGLGGLGLAVARWMVERGARSLVLVSRRGASAPAAPQAVAELERAGVRVLVCSADVSREEDVLAVLADIDRGFPELRGVVHAAMVLEDSLLIHLDRARIERVLAPKVRGTWNLHVHTAGRPLDFFVLFSSLSSVVGHAGQGNYAAANAFLDAMAWHRRALGLPALTVNWGYLGEVGYLAEHPELGPRLERQGVLSITIREAVALLEHAMQRQHIQVSAMRVDWSRFCGLGATGRIPARFSHLRSRPTAQKGQSATFDGKPGLALRHDLMAIAKAGPDERRGLVYGLLRDKVARVLGISSDRLEVDRPLLQLGIDSLMAVELRNWLERELHVSLPIVELMRSPNLSRLGERVLERLETAGAASSPTNGGACAQQAWTNRNGAEALGTDREELRAKVAELPGAEVDALLAALLEERVQGTARRMAAS
jgi:acyl transferase domain-containing protein/NADPH:quinone reductase-like Zn-dependent oxidoreductase/aryl carrier-like protein